MASLYIAEFKRLGLAGFGAHAQSVLAPPEAEQKVAIGGSSTPSSAFGSTTRMIRVHTDAICSIAIGANPTATASLMRLAAGQTEYFGVNAGDKIAVITNS